MAIIRFMSDFETTTDIEDCRVWGWGACCIDDTDIFIHGTDIDSWFTWVISYGKSITLYKHNLKFDGEFILYFLYRNGFKLYTGEPRYLREGEFCTLISDKGAFYSIEISIKKRKNGHSQRIKIIDSLKILPFSVADIAVGFGLEETKGSIDYTMYRQIGYVPTAEEIAYIKTDVVIVAKALSELFSQGLDRMTQGSNAVKDYKQILGKKLFQRYFPTIEYDREIRKSYKGGYTHLAPDYKNKDISTMIAFDVVSLYPSVMVQKPLPYGHGISYEGKYSPDKYYPLFIQKLSCQFELKEKHIPTIQLKNNLSFNPVEYVTSSEQSNGRDVPIELTLTSVDLKLFIEHYHLYNVEWLGGWKFRQTKKAFVDYIAKWFAVKDEASKTGNKPMRQLAKLMLNALYGKTATAPYGKSKFPVYYEGEDFIRYKVSEEEARDTFYLPAGTFITAWARDKTIRAAQANFDRWVYSDTDSLYLTGDTIPDNLEVGENLGQWEFEKHIERAKFLRAKSYILELSNNDINGKNKSKTVITCAGMPERCYKFITWEKFRPGEPIPGKLQAKRVPGGVVLKEQKFTFKLDKF